MYIYIYIFIIKLSFLDQDDKPLPSNYPITPITKKDSNLKPKATSTPLSSLASRYILPTRTPNL